MNKEELVNKFVGTLDMLIKHYRTDYAQTIATIQTKLRINDTVHWDDASLVILSHDAHVLETLIKELEKLKGIIMDLALQ